MRCKFPKTDRAFSLLEILVSVTLLTVILVVTAALIDQSSRVVRHSNAGIDAFQAARQVFESMTAQIGQATLNTYWDYYDAGFKPYRLATTAEAASFTPQYYGRYSDLHFICGSSATLLPYLPQYATQTAGHALFFTSPRGVTANASYKKLPGLMSACGYFVAFGSDQADRPAIISGPASYRWRWRLMELSEPAEELQIFNDAGGGDWFARPVRNSQVRCLADNIIALIVWPRLAPQDDADGTRLTRDYTYDSRTRAAWSGSPPDQPVQASQLPPTVQVAMVAIDEVSAERLSRGDNAAPAAISDALGGLFERSTSADYTRDLATLEERLTAARVRYHIFYTSINLKESKWSQ